jgi:hypothetical protein
MWLPQLPLGAAALDGKFVFQEEDTASHRARPLSWQRPCPDARSTMGVHTRNLAGMLAAGGSQWWHDFAGEGWLDDPELVAHIGRLARIADEALTAGPARPAEVVVFASKRSARRLRQDAALTDALYPRQVSELARLGAPCDWHFVEDLPRLLEQQRLGPWRLAVFLDAICLSEDERRAIREGLLRDGRTVLWCYAAGLLDDAGLSPERMGDLVGVPVRLAGELRRAEAETWLDGALTRYGPQRPIAPLLVAADGVRESGSHREWGRLIASAEPALVEASLPEARSWLSAVPSLPATALRAIARRAGVHLYVETGDQVIAGRGFLAVHAAWSGERSVRLPRPCRVEDAFTGAVLADGADTFTLRLRTGDTLLARVRETGQPAGGDQDGLPKRL